MTTDSKKLLSHIGLAKKAGKIIAGTDMVVDEIRKRKIFLVVYASDISANTVKKIGNACSYYQIECHEVPASKDELGFAVGKPFAACIGVTDENLSKLIKSNL